MQKVIDEKKYLYSFIMYYRGGTYISQVISSDVRSALFLWANELNVKNIKYLGTTSKNELINKAYDELPIPIDQMTNIWYVDFLINGCYMYAHIIKHSRNRPINK
jgi:pantothenate kinase